MRKTTALLVILAVASGFTGISAVHAGMDGGKIEGRQPAGFESKSNVPARKSIFYRGPFTVGDSPVHQPAKVYLPVQYDRKKSWPLVVLLHGFTATGDMENAYLGLSARVSLRGFILVTPNGSHSPRGTRGRDGKNLDGVPFWNATDACCDFGKTNVDDVGYLKNVIADVKAQYQVDPSRVYVFGHSNGAFMANRLSCEMGDQIAAIAGLAGGTFKEDASCRNPLPIPYLHIHAVDDPTISYGNSEEYAGGQATVEHWLKRNGCDVNTYSEKPKNLILLIPASDTQSQAWDQCASGKQVELWTIKAFESSLHNPHVPLFRLNFTNDVLDFLLSKKL